jgi:hypothetical protein
VGPDERLVRAVDHDELRTRDASVKHLRVVDRDSLIVRGGDDERRASDLIGPGPPRNVDTDRVSIRRDAPRTRSLGLPPYQRVRV